MNGEDNGTYIELRIPESIVDALESRSDILRDLIAAAKKRQITCQMLSGTFDPTTRTWRIVCTTNGCGPGRTCKPVELLPQGSGNWVCQCA